MQGLAKCKYTQVFNKFASAWKSVWPEGLWEFPWHVTEKKSMEILIKLIKVTTFPVRIGVVTHVT